MAKKSNFSGDVDLVWLNKGTRQRVYRDIAMETEKGNTGLATAKDLKAEATNLADLLQNFETTTTESFGAIEWDMQNTYAAAFGLVYNPDSGEYYDADRGEYYQTVFAKIRADAEYISESFTNVLGIAMENVDALGTTITELANIVNGEIRRGYIEVVEDGAPVTYFGIAISSRDIFTGHVQNITSQGESYDYYEIDDRAPCFGLYTATGWQFWREGKRMGWYDTEDGQLHVDHINVESDFQMGPWKFVNNGTSFGIKYIGS